MWWLIESSVLKTLELKQNFIPDAAAQATFLASESRILTVAGGTAEISVQGVLTKTPSFMAMLFGGGNTTYSDIIEALASAEQDPTIENIVLSIDSPGGEIDGLFGLLDAIKATNKPTIAKVDGLAASAAFAIAASADTIEATNISSRFGSIGIVATFWINTGEVQITSTESPNKRPDITTKEGKAVVVEELDSIHEIFVDAIAAGRNISTKKVNADFGRGSVFLAGKALKRGMIDSIQSETHAKPTTANGGNNIEVSNPMNLTELKASHPETYALAVADGVKNERVRVSAHLVMGEASGDIKAALKAVEDGIEYTAASQAQYLAASMNRKDLKNRGDDNVNVDSDNEVDNPDAQQSGNVLELVSTLTGYKG